MSCSICREVLVIEAITLPEDCPHRFCFSCIEAHVRFRNCCPRCHRGIKFIQLAHACTGAFVGQVMLVPSPEHDAQVTPHRSQLSPEGQMELDRMMKSPSPATPDPTTPARPQDCYSPLRVKRRLAYPSRCPPAKRRLTYQEEPEQKPTADKAIQCCIVSSTSPLLNCSNDLFDDELDYKEFQPPRTSTPVMDFERVCMYLGY